MCKNWTFRTGKGAKEGKGGKDSTTDCHGSESKLFENHIEDKDEDGPNASAGSLLTQARWIKILGTEVFTSICLREGTRLLGAHSTM